MAGKRTSGKAGRNTSGGTKKPRPSVRGQGAGSKAVRTKAAIVTFKVEDSLLAALHSIPNRSEFIRSALLAALESSCPLCRGTGILTPEQKKHWETFAVDHAMQECKKCHEWHLVCEHGERAEPHR